MLVVHRSERADTLVAALGELLRAPTADPFTEVVVAVPSRGVERWLAQRLGHVLGAAPGADDGVCALVRFPSSADVLDAAAAAALPAYGDAIEAWAPERARWAVWEALEEHTDAAWARPLQPVVLARGREGRRVGLSARVARLFARYGGSRPALLRAWARGDDVDGLGAAVPADLAWQPPLWREVRARLGPAPAELLDRALAAIGPGDGFSVFGATRLSPARVAVLHALGRHRPVHLWLPHPSPALWNAVAGAGERPGPRAARPAPVRDPLLASTSRDVRELQQWLATGPTEVVRHPAPEPPATVLGALQRALRTDGADRGDPLRPDSSLVVHTAHGPARQVEVAREAVLHLLAADPTLEPRDVVVMCPDVETFAPLLAAAFGMEERPGGHPAAALRLRLADRAPGSTNPLLRLLAAVVEIGAGRLTATEVLDLAATAPVRRRFRFDDDALERLRTWTTEAGARWGLDAEHREAFQVRGIGQNTWRSALDRLLLGAAMEDDSRHLGGAVPVDDVDSADLDLLGRFAEFVDRLDATVRALTGTATVAEWIDRLAGCVDDPVTGLGDPDQPWQSAALHRELAGFAAATGGRAVQLDAGELAALVRERLVGRPTRSSFRTGGITVCTLVPMRAVPHRVVVLLGMDDGRFPRRGTPDGDDLLARSPQSGERDPRSEDRQLFLDALGAVTDHLLVVHTGHDPRTGAPLPPCVPVAELLDALDPLVVGGREAVTHRHPLQPFDPRAFRAEGPFSFDPAALAGARASIRDRVPPPAPFAGVLPPPPPTGDDVVELDDLVGFFRHPVRGYLRQRLDVASAARDEDPEDRLPLESGGLPEWAIGDRVLRECLRATDAESARAQVASLERLRGALPPGSLGAAALARIGGRVNGVLSASAEERARPAAAPVDVDVVLAVPGRGDVRLLGTVSGMRGGPGEPPTVLTVSYSSVRAGARLQAWIRYLAVVAHVDADLAPVAVLVGRYADGADRRIYRGLDREAARTALADLVAVRGLGLRRPLPLPVDTAAAYAGSRSLRRKVEAATTKAQQEWQFRRFTPERDEPEHLLVHGGPVEFAALTEEPAGAPWTFDDETSLFGALARRVWEPLLQAEGSTR